VGVIQRSREWPANKQAGWQPVSHKNYRSLSSRKASHLGLSAAPDLPSPAPMLAAPTGCEAATCCCRAEGYEVNHQLVDCLLLTWTAPQPALSCCAAAAALPRIRCSGSKRQSQPLAANRYLLVGQVRCCCSRCALALYLCCVPLRLCQALSQKLLTPAWTRVLFLFYHNW
jgi:hypothetical protein